MSNDKRRRKSRNQAIQKLNKLLDSPETTEVIHYSCESFFDRIDGKSPRVTSIAVYNVANAQALSFSIHQIAERKKIDLAKIDEQYDELEKQMLQEFYEFVKHKPTSNWIHWNMRDINYGFPALEHRYKVLGGDPVHISAIKLYDAGHMLPKIFGPNYIEHPRFEKLIDYNAITKRAFLSGADEAAAFENKEYVKLHQSTLRKVHCLAEIVERTWKGQLKTKSSWLEKHGASVGAIVEGISDHWIYKILGFVGIIFSIASIFFSSGN